jgi:hypothetical protein
MKNFLKHTVFLSINLLLFCSNAYSQREWDIGYVPIDYIDDRFINKEIRLDIKRSDTDTLCRNFNQVFATSDTCSIEIDNEIFLFYESNRSCSGFGLLNDLILSGYNKDKSKKLIISKMVLTSIGISTITLKASIYIEIPRYADLYNDYSLTFNKNNIKGLMCRVHN